MCYFCSERMFPCHINNSLGVGERGRKTCLSGSDLCELYSGMFPRRRREEGACDDPEEGRRCLLQPEVWAGS